MKSSFLFAAVLMTGMAAVAQSGAISGQVSGIPRAKALPGAFPPPPTPAVVYAVPLSGKALTPIADKTYTVDQKWTQFVPGVSVVPVGATVEFTNDDTVKHDVMWKAIGNDTALGRNLGVHNPDQTVSYRFTRAGAIHLQCLVHPSMSAWLYVAPTGYSTVTSTSGKYSLSNLPDGRYRVVVWHPGVATQSQIVSVTGHAKLNFNLKK